MDRTDAAWAAWLAGTTASFAVLEVLAYRRHRFPTLTCALRRWLGVDPRTRWGRAALVGFAAGWAALVAHIARTTP